MHPYTSLPAFLYHDLTVSVDRFKGQMVLEFVTWKPQQLFCTNFYFAVEDIWLKTKMTLKITECYAILINCFWNWDDWTDRQARLFDKCGLSKDTEVSIVDHKWVINNVYLLGDKDANTVKGISCVPGKNNIIPIWRPVEILG